MAHRILFSVLMSLQLSILMTAWITWLNLGFSEEYLSNWFHAWLLAWPAAAIISFFSGPKSHQMANQIIERTNARKTKN